MQKQSTAIKASRDSINDELSDMRVLFDKLMMVYNDGSDVIADMAKPISYSFLVKAKNVMDTIQELAKNQIEQLKLVQQTAFDNDNIFKEKSRRALMEHATSMASQLRLMSKEKFGSFLSQEFIDGCFEPEIEKMLEYVSEQVQKIKDDEQPVDISEELENIKHGEIDARFDIFHQSISCVVEIVGDDIAYEVAELVFGLEFVEEYRQRNRSIRQQKMMLSSRAAGQQDKSKVGGLMGAAISTIDAGGQIGKKALQTTGQLASSMANGIGNAVDAVAQTAGNIVGNIASSASNILSSIGSNSEGSKGGVFDVAKNVASSMLDCTGNIGKALADGVGSIAKTAGSVVGDVASGLMDFAGAAWGASMDLAGGLLSSIGDMLGFGNDEAEEANDEVQEAADQMDQSNQEQQQQQEEQQQQDEEKQQEATDENTEQGEQAKEGADDINSADPDEEPIEPSEIPSIPTEDEGDDGDDDDSSNNEQDDQMNPDQDKTADATTYPTASQSGEKSNIVPAQDKPFTFGWKTVTNNVPRGIEFMMHDGDQQIFNPYGCNTGNWTMYSFRPKDAQESWPQIAITPSSFEAIRSMNDMLNRIPFIVVKEYFFKNTGATMIDFVKKIYSMAMEAVGTISGDNPSDPAAKTESSQGSAAAKSSGNGFLDKIKEKFQDIKPIGLAVIDIPYILYCGLRQRQYGNTYIFPYIVDQSTVINKSSNDSEWGEGNKSIMDAIKGAINNVAQGIAGVAAGLMGSSAKPAELFPAPTWGGPSANSEKDSFKFDLILINDHIIKARNNYMCVNTIIHNNRIMQKAILAFPGALYEVWLPTGQRHLMCTGNFQLYPLGLNRQAPDDFFKGEHGAGSPKIGVSNGDYAIMQNPHKEGGEVIPDAYKLSIEFKSCLANNMNTSVFQYYVKMSGYDSGDMASGVSAGETEDGSVLTKKLADGAKGALQMFGISSPSSSSSSSNNSGGDGGGDKQPTKYGLFAKSSNIRKNEASDELDEITEKFEEATFNKRLAAYQHSEQGEQGLNSKGVLETIRKAQDVVNESQNFLEKLYNAPQGSLWYRDNPQDEIYTTMEPDYREKISKNYQSKIMELRKTDQKLKSYTVKVQNLDSEISRTTELEQREVLLTQRVQLQKEKNSIQKSRNQIFDELIQLDTDIIQRAFDVQDDIVSVKKTEITFRVFKQAWNEKILNSYEKDKLQYLTSDETVEYFRNKLRQLEKFDVHGVLNHNDWFFRVVVLEYVIQEMHRLILWFKDCSWDDFDTVYRITRKLRMLLLDVESIWEDQTFDINQTNLFQVSDQDIKDFTKIDDMLEGNTLYELFQSIRPISAIDDSEEDDEEDSDDEEEQKEIIADRESEIQSDKLRSIRQDIIVRYWGSEANLTKEAYDLANSENDKEIEIEGSDIKTLKELKERIIELKLKQRNQDEDSELSLLLGAFTSQVRFIKETLIIKKIERMNEDATSEIRTKDKDSLMP